MKKYALIIVAVLCGAVSGLTAEPERYYPIDEALAARIARDRTAGIADDDTRMIRENAIAEAFSALFRAAAVKTRDMDRIRSRMAVAGELLDSLGTIDRLIATRTAMLEAASDSTRADLNNMALKAESDSLMARIEIARVALDEAVRRLRRDSTALVRKRTEADSVRKAVEFLQMQDSIVPAEHDMAIEVEQINSRLLK